MADSAYQRKASRSEGAMYTFDSRVRYSEIAEDGLLALPAVIDYMQDCTNFQSEDLGVGLAYHKEHGLRWVQNAWGKGLRLEHRHINMKKCLDIVTF